ncbi:retrovirus-related pol polyprotein from transposon TNT 1-94 [Tanacetum coccineum]
MSKVLQERGFGSLPSSTKTNSRDQVKSISTATADLSEIRRMEYGPYAVLASRHRNGFPKIVPFLGDYITTAVMIGRRQEESKFWKLMITTCLRKKKIQGALPYLVSLIIFVLIKPLTIKQPRGIAENVLVRIGKFVFPINFIILDIPEDDDVPLILGRPFLSTAHVKINVFKRKVTLRAGEEKLVFKSVKPAYSMIKQDLVANEINSMVYSEKCQSVELSRAF